MLTFDNGALQPEKNMLNLETGFRVLFRDVNKEWSFSIRRQMVGSYVNKCNKQTITGYWMEQSPTKI